MAKLQLNQSGHLVKLPNKLLHYEPTHTSRYLILASLLSQLGKPKDMKILDVGGKKGLLRLFPGFTPTIIDIEASDEPNFVQGSALAMPFEDNTFDYSVSCDVLEHIAEGDRHQFIAEMLRVSKKGIILCAPFGSKSNEVLERELNDYYDHLTGTQHRWLREHIDNVLPNEKAVETQLTKAQLPYVKFHHFSPENWRLIVRNHFLNTAFGDNEALQTSVDQLYEGYYKKMCLFDYAEDGYRTFFWVSKTGKPELVLPTKAKTERARTSFASSTKQSGLDLLETEMKNLRTARQQANKLKTDSLSLQQERDALMVQLESMRAHPVWRTLRKANAARRRIVKTKKNA